jgi:hypothetical protein
VVAVTCCVPPVSCRFSLPTPGLVRMLGSIPKHFEEETTRDFGSVNRSGQGCKLDRLGLYCR